MVIVSHPLKIIKSAASIFFVFLVLFFSAPGNLFASTNHTSLAASPLPNESLAAFPPTGHFVTHIFPGANRINITPTGELFAYGGTSVHKSTDSGYLWRALDTTVVNAGNLWKLEPSPDYADDQTLFLGTNGGFDALWISQDGGSTWALPANSITGPVRAIALSPNYVNDQVMYVGTGQAPWLYRSTDRGQHWEGVGYPGSEAIIKIILSPNYVNDHTIFFLTSGSNLWTFVDGKKSSSLNPSVETQVDLQIYDFVVSPNYGADSILYLATNVGVFLTHDGGFNWSLISPQVFFTLSLSPDYVSSGMMFGGSTTGGMRSVNAGYGWENVITPGVYNYSFSPYFPSDSTIFAGTDSGLLISSNRGVSWGTQSPVLATTEFGLETMQVSPGFSTDSTLFIGPAVGEIGGLYKSVDGGINVVQLTTPESGKLIYTLSGTYQDDHTVFISFDNRLYISTDGGTQWSPLPTLPAAPVVLRTSPHFSTDRTMFMATHEAGMFRSTNGGTSWQFLSTSPSLYVDALEISSGYPTQPTLFAFADGFARSDDGGDTWFYPGKAALLPGILLTLSPSYPDDQTLFYASGETINRSRDGAQTWEDIHYRDYFWGDITVLAVSPRFATDQTLIAGSSAKQLYLSQDAGDHWYPLQGVLPDERRGAGIGYDQSGKMIPLASSTAGVYRFVWDEQTPLAPQSFHASAGPGDPVLVNRQVNMRVTGNTSPGIILGESADWLEITPISGTLPLDFTFTFDTSQLIDKLDTTITADVYWSATDVQHYSIPVSITRTTDRTLLPLVRH